MSKRKITPTDRLILCYETLVSQAKEWFEHGAEGKKECKEEDEMNSSMRRMGRKLGEYQTDILELIFELDNKQKK